MTVYPKIPALGRIGNTVVDGTAGSILFVDADGNLGQDNDNLFWDDSNNRLGLGTTTPSALLLELAYPTLGGGANNIMFAMIQAGATQFSIQRDGDVTTIASVTVGTVGSFRFAGANTRISGAANAQITFHTHDGTERMRIDDDPGNIGIGTTNPTDKLHIEDETSQVFVKVKNTQANSIAGLLLENDAQQWNLRVNTGDNFDIRDGTAGSTKLTVKTDGNVGIGTTTPSSTLDVDGSLAIPTIAKTANYTVTVSDHIILADASSTAFIVTLPAASGVAGRMYHIKKTDSSANAVTVDGNASETIDGGTTATIAAQFESIQIVCDGSNWHII